VELDEAPVTTRQEVVDQEANNTPSSFEEPFRCSTREIRAPQKLIEELKDSLIVSYIVLIVIPD